MQEVKDKDKELPPAKTNWPKVYLLVMGWFALFILLMYLFTIFTA